MKLNLMHQSRAQNRKNKMQSQLLSPPSKGGDLAGVWENHFFQPFTDGIQSNINFTVLMLFIFLFYNTVFSENLSINEAIQIALKNNYSILSAQNQTEISKNNYTKGNAGKLPKIDISFSKTNSLTNSYQENVSGSNSDYNGTYLNSLGAGVSCNWTFYDGGVMNLNYEKLGMLVDIDENTLLYSTELIISQVLELYYNIIRNQKLLEVYKETISLSEERVRIVQDRYNIGSASKLELLQAQLDLNSDSSIFISQETTIKNLKTQFNNLLAREVKSDFETDSQILIDTGLIYDALINTAKKQNILIKIAEKNNSINFINLNISKSKLFPKFNLFSNYSFSFTEADRTSYNKSKSDGLNFGLSINYNIFDGYNTDREINNSKLQAAAGEIKLSELKNKIESDIFQAFTTYYKNLEVVRLEEKNLIIAYQSIDVAREVYKAGSSSNIEFREAQKNYIAAQNRYIQTKYFAKISEKELLRLSGMLINNK